MDNIGLLLQNNYGADEPMVIGGQTYVWFQCRGEYVTKKTLKNLIIRIKDARRRYLTRIPVKVDLNGITFEDKLTQEYLWEEIPNARDKIKFDENGKIIETGRFQDVVNDTRRKLLYFKYVNEEFYNEVFEILQEMENYVVDSYNKKIVTAEEKTYFYSELNEKMGKFYKIVYDQYHGIKRRKAKE